MSVMRRMVFDNPVLTKELRIRMRGARAYWTMAGYLLFLSLVMFFQYLAWWASAHDGGLSSGSKMGQQFFSWLAITQGFLVAFLTPAITAGAITVEREQETLEMLEVTRLPRAALAVGKLLSAVTFTGLLLLSSLPLTSVCFFLGGVSPEEVIGAYALLFAASVLTGALGLLWSTIARTTASAVVLTYGSLVAPGVLVLTVYTTAMVSSYSYNAAPASITMRSLPASLLGVVSPNALADVPSGMRVAEMRHWFSLPMAPWLPPTLTYLLLGLALAAAAAARLDTFPERKASAARLLVAAFVAQQALFLFGARFSGPVAVGRDALGAPIAALAYPSLLLLALAPVFCTGEIRPVEARRWASCLAWGWTPEGLRRGRLASGLPYLAALCALVIALYAGSLALTGRADAIARGLGPAAAVMMASLVGFAAIGQLFSALTRSRWAALSLTLCALAVALVAPMVALASYSSEPVHSSPSVWLQLIYLNPFAAIWDLADPSLLARGDLPLLFSRAPLWVVGSVGHALLAVMSLVLAQPLIAREAARPALPYDDMAARA